MESVGPEEEMAVLEFDTVALGVVLCIKRKHG